MLRRTRSVPPTYREMCALQRQTEQATNIMQVRDLFWRDEVEAAYAAAAPRMHAVLQEVYSEPRTMPDGLMYQWVCFHDRKTYDVYAETEAELVRTRKRYAVAEMLELFDELAMITRYRPPLMSAAP